MAPRPSQEFAAQLDARVADAFGEASAPAAAPVPRRRRLTLPRWQPLALGGLACALVAVVICVALSSTGPVVRGAAAAVQRGLTAPPQAAQGRPAAGGSTMAT